MEQMIEESCGVAMDLKNGWPEEGHCNKILESTRLEIGGGAWVELLVDANYGCMYYEEDSALS